MPLMCCRVVCKQLGLPPTRTPNVTVGGAYYGQGTGGLPIYLHCTGSEASWEQCSTGGLGTRSCECPVCPVGRYLPGFLGLHRAKHVPVRGICAATRQPSHRSS